MLHKHHFNTLCQELIWESFKCNSLSHMQMIPPILFPRKPTLSHSICKQTADYVITKNSTENRSWLLSTLKGENRMQEFWLFHIQPIHVFSSFSCQLSNSRSYPRNLISHWWAALNSSCPRKARRFRSESEILRFFYSSACKSYRKLNVSP